MKRTSNISLLVEICLRSIGMWPDSVYSNLQLSIYMTAIVISQYHQYAYVFTHFDLDNLSLLIDSLGVTLANTLTFLKIFALWWNRRTICWILMTIDSDWKECVNNSYGFSMTKLADLSCRCANVLISSHIIAGFFLSVVFYVVRLVKYADSEISREFPVKMEFSFEVKESPIYEFIVIGQIIYEMSLATIVGMVNGLLATLVLHVGGQMDIMKQALMQISADNDADLSIALRDLICRHQKIITMSNSIETVFSAIALMQILWNTLIICCAGFLIIIGLNSNEDFSNVVRSLLPCMVKVLEVFVFCYAGEFLSAKSKSISDAVYGSLWYDMSPSDNRVLLLIMVRSQKRLTITAGKIVDLNLEGFTNVMKACGSYMSVLYAMY